MLTKAAKSLRGTAQRQAARMAREAAWVDETEAAAIEAARLDAETARILQEMHDAPIAYQIKVAEAAQTRRDDQEAAARAGEPAKPSPLYVRGAVYRKARGDPAAPQANRSISGSLAAIDGVPA